MESFKIISNYNYSSDETDETDEDNETSKLNNIKLIKQLNEDEEQDDQLKQLGLPMSFKGNNKFNWGNGKNIINKKEKGLKHVSHLHTNIKNHNNINNLESVNEKVDYDDLQIESKPTQGLKHLSIEEYWQTYLDWFYEFNKDLYYETINKEVVEEIRSDSMFDASIDDLSNIIDDIPKELNKVKTEKLPNLSSNDLLIKQIDYSSEVEYHSFERKVEKDINIQNNNDCINDNEELFDDNNYNAKVDEGDNYEEEEFTEEDMIVSAALKGDSFMNNKILFDDDAQDVIEIENVYKAVEDNKKDRYENARPVKKYKPNSIKPTLIKTKVEPYIVKEKVVEDVFDTTRLHMLSDENSRALEEEELWRMSNAIRDPEKYKPILHIAFDEDDDEIILNKNDSIINEMDLLHSESGDDSVDELGIQNDRDETNIVQVFDDEISEEDYINNMKKRVHKYWYQRYLLFDLFDHGILMDEIGWYSATPVRIARHIAQRARGKIVIDAFCGIGGNAISFAHYCSRVICIEINPVRLELCKHNAKIYGVEDKMEFILGDFNEISKTLKGDIVFLGPPWGGPNYSELEVFDINHFAGKELFELSSKITTDIVYCLPKNINQQQIIDLGNGLCEIEKNVHNNRIKCITAYYGSLVSTNN